MINHKSEPNATSNLYTYSGQKPFVNLLLAVKLIIQMGNQNSLINNEQFVKEDWQPVQKLPDCQIWQNRREAAFRVEQYEIYSQNEAEMKQERKMYELRRRNPLLVSAYYFESRLTEEFCSSHYRQSLYLERIPIRLMDVEHIPYPDCLHLYEVCLKGFAQLARTAGCFLADESMIGINERGRVKAWLNDDFSKSSPFCGKVTEENMVRSVIQTVDRNVDSQQMPAGIPTVRNFLYKNADSLTFDVAIWEFGEFVKRFNNGNIPDKLECIDKVGGIYAIANRQRWEHEEAPIHEDKFTGTGFSEVSGAYNKLQQENAQHLANSPQFRQQEIVQPVREIIQPQKPQINFVSQPVGIFNVQNQLQNHQLVREIPYLRPQIIIPSPNHQVVLSPRNSQQIYFEPPKQRPVEVLQSQLQPPPHIPLQPQLQPKPQIIQNPLFIPPKSPTVQPRSVIVTQEFPRSPIQKPIPPLQVIPASPAANSRPKPFFLSQLKKNQSQKQSFPQPAPKSRVPAFIPQTNNAPKFTVEVIPGKVYPQKSSTIFKQNSNTSNPSNQKKEPTLLDQQPIVNTEKTVEEVAPPRAQENKQPEQPSSKQEQIVLSQEKHEQYEKPEDAPDVPLQYTEEVTIKHEKVEQKRQPIFQKVSNNFESLEKNIVVSKSYEVQEKIPEKVQPPTEVIAEQSSQASNAGVREDRMSVWTAGSHDNTIDYEQMEKRLAISFNPGQEAQQFIPFAQQKSYQSIHNQPIAEKTEKEDEDTQPTPQIENTVQQERQQGKEGQLIRATGRFNFSHLEVKQSLYQDNPYLADYQPSGIQRQYIHLQNDGKSSPDFLRKLNEFKQTDHFSSYSSFPIKSTYNPLTFTNTPTLAFSTYQQKSTSLSYNPFTSSNDYFVSYDGYNYHTSPGCP